jgi:hypothetical protein
MMKGCRTAFSSRSLPASSKTDKGCSSGWTSFKTGRWPATVVGRRCISLWSSLMAARHRDGDDIRHAVHQCFLVVLRSTESNRFLKELRVRKSISAFSAIVTDRTHSPSLCILASLEMHTTMLEHRMLSIPAEVRFGDVRMVE